MCGIAGYFGNQTINSDRLSSCAAQMRRRGPDDEGLVTRRTSDGRNLYLLHSRLSIIDLDRRARQPFERGSDVLCYNGEVYNYLELREGLKKTGCTFQTASDTEVLAELLRTQGLAALSACEGMWSFAWFDGEREELHLSRDRFGEKPLYLHEDDQGVYFGSEPKFIFAMLGRKLPVNQTQIKRYLVNGYKSLYKGRETFFQGLSEIEPGSYRTYRHRSRQDHAYWKPNFVAQDDSITYVDAVSRVREALISSVELRLRADVPVAFCLSGGVDSNALIGIAKRELGYDAHGFTIMNTDARYEERDMVETSVRELRLRHAPVPVDTDNFLPNLRELVSYHDSPVSTITYYAQWRLMQAIRQEGYKVSVSGTGADELFSGYFDHHNAYLAAMKEEKEALYLEARDHWSTVVAPIVRNPFLNDPDYFVKQPDARFHIFLDSHKFSDMLMEPFLEPFHEGNYSPVLLRNRMANELLHESVPVILHEDDLNAMYFSIENRSPFLDSALSQLCQSIPTRHLIQEGRAKSVLREAVRGLAPDAVIDNPRKVGFNVPLFDYLEVDNPEVREELLLDSPIFELVKREEIESMLGQEELTNSRSKFLFNFINAKIFLEEHAG